MGYLNEINYILKCSTPKESEALYQNLTPKSIVEVSKSGHRTFVIDSPIMIADHNWNIVAMVKIIKSQVSKNETILTAEILTVLTLQESLIATKIIQEAEKAK